MRGLRNNRIAAGAFAALVVLTMVVTALTGPGPRTSKVATTAPTGDYCSTAARLEELIAAATNSTDGTQRLASNAEAAALLDRLDDTAPDPIAGAVTTATSGLRSLWSGEPIDSDALSTATARINAWESTNCN